MPGEYRWLAKEKVAEAIRKGLPGLTDTGSDMYRYTIDTVYGLLRVSACEGAIRTRFKDVPPEAPPGAPLNRYSGKWNFEGISSEADVKFAISMIQAIVP